MLTPGHEDPSPPESARASTAQQGFINQGLDEDDIPSGSRRSSQRGLAVTRSLCRDPEDSNEEEEEVVHTVVAVRGKRSWRNWWGRKQKTTYVTICEPPSAEPGFLGATDNSPR